MVTGTARRSQPKRRAATEVPWYMQMKARREAKGFSLRDMEVEIALRVPIASRISSETIRAWEGGMLPKHGPDLTVLLAIGQILDMQLSELGGNTETSFALLRQLVSATEADLKSTCFVGKSGTVAA